MPLDYIDVKERKTKGQLDAEKKNDDLQARLDEMDKKFKALLDKQPK